MISFFFLIILLNFLIAIFFEKFSKIVNIFEIPNQSHKIHKGKVAPIGGIILYINLLFSIIFFYCSKDKSEILENLIIFSNYKEIYVSFFIYSLFVSTGVVDDKINLKANLKLILSIIYILILILLDQNLLIDKLIFNKSNFVIQITYLKIFFIVFCFITFINALNMFDGINLQTSLYSLLICIIFLIKIEFDLLLNLLIIFLLFFSFLNYQSRCFLGDGGSLGLGFIFAYYFVKSYNIQEIILVDQIFLIMLLPGAELIRLSISRVVSGKHPFKADQNHLHHLLIKKFNLVKSLIINFLLIIIPLFLYEFDINVILIILLTLSLYFLIISRLK